MATKAELPTQHLGAVPTVMTLCLAVWGVRSSESLVIDASWALGVGYLCCDFWLWSLHCYLDRLECLKNPISHIRYLASIFQDHHTHPRGLLRENHVSEIDALCIGTAGLALAIGAWSSAAMKLLVAAHVGWGCIASANHFYCHAQTCRFPIPYWASNAHKWGLLPAPKFHKQHHTAPHDTNWSFLHGLGQVYEACHWLTGQTYVGAQLAFILSSPLTMQAVGMFVGF